eukprot:GHVN01029897.1.p1 GENE.GHVN01029897.1~~GHVN01029897.1.p1  ORF type:complete len:307 (+),score=40.90 GHVN01029897.1:128-922(+)
MGPRVAEHYADGLRLFFDSINQIRNELVGQNGEMFSVGVIGQAGSGKTNLCHSLFGTANREPFTSRFIVHSVNERVLLVDYPGVLSNDNMEQRNLASLRNSVSSLNVIIILVEAHERTYNLRPLLDMIGEIPFVICVTKIDLMIPGGKMFAAIRTEVDMENLFINLRQWMDNKITAWGVRSDQMKILEPPPDVRIANAQFATEAYRLLMEHSDLFKRNSLRELIEDVAADEGFDDVQLSVESPTDEGERSGPSTPAVLSTYAGG